MNGSDHCQIRYTIQLILYDLMITNLNRLVMLKWINDNAFQPPFQSIYGFLTNPSCNIIWVDVA